MIEINSVSADELAELIESGTADEWDAIFSAAAEVRRRSFGNRVYLRGLIEISSRCVNDCLYCGLRHSNGRAVRYRLNDGQILQCCRTGYALGFRTFVLQGGEDAAYTDAALCGILEAIKSNWPNAAVTLSLGERSRESYLALRRAGADRYLLRHEAAAGALYSRLHPAGMSLETRKKCLYTLKELGYQTGAGFLVGPPFQTASHLAQDILFLRELQPHMVGIGPFIPHADTPFAAYPQGSVELTLRMIALTRLLLPRANLPATTALATLAHDGRERGFAVGANVAMPNLSPLEVRDAYALYNGKLNTGAEAAEGLNALRESLLRAGFEADMSRGDAVI